MLMRHRNILSSVAPDVARPGAIPARPLYANSERLRIGSFFSSLAKAASTSSFWMRAAGLPGCPRFCSSVPSPIMPGCGGAGVFLLSLGLGLRVMSGSPCGCACPGHADRSVDEVTGGAASRLGAFRTAALTARSAEQASAPPASRNRLYRIAGQLVDKEKFDHGRIHRPH